MRLRTTLAPELDTVTRAVKSLVALVGAVAGLSCGESPFEPRGLGERVPVGSVIEQAVTGAIRSEALPDIPTISEFLLGYEASGWWGVGAPKSTPPGIIEKLNKEINASLADPKMRARLVDLGGEVLTLSPGEFGKFIAEETEKWGKVIRAANIKAD